MKNRISSALKHFALSATLRLLPQRQRALENLAPQPRRLPNELPQPSTDDAWMFDKVAATAVEHRMEMLGNEMDRLSGTLSGLRAFLGTVAIDAPLMADYEVSPQAAPLIVDRDLFEGERLAVSPTYIPAAGEAGYLFDEGSTLIGQSVQPELHARAA
jgi:hypothetical protein